MDQIDILPIGDNCVKIHRKGIVNQIVLVVPNNDMEKIDEGSNVFCEYYWKWFEGDPADRRIGKDKAILLVGDDALEMAIDIINANNNSYRDFSNPLDKINRNKYEFIEKEIKVLLGFLRMVENPMSDIMLEDIIGFGSFGLELFWEEDQREDNHLTWDQLISDLASKDEILNQKKDKIFQLLSIREHLIEMKRRMGSVNMLVSKTIELTGITSHLLTECNYNGLRLLEDLVEVAREFTSLNEFIMYLEKVVAPKEQKGSMSGSTHFSEVSSNKGSISIGR